MWARKRPDIGWGDLASAAFAGMNPATIPPKTEALLGNWFPADEAMVCLSVRSGFDLLLQSLRLPCGSEVLLSAITIPGMLQIIEHHGLIPVPIEVDKRNLESSAEKLASAINEKTRILLVAHLFGCQISMKSVIQLAQQHELILVEDCAQAFVGRRFSGHAESDVSLFSFGPIKTATALGGAVVRVKNRELRDQMCELQDEYPFQSRWGFGARIAKYALLKAASLPLLYGAFFHTIEALGIDHDRLVSQLGRSFAGSTLLLGIRKRPCPALLQLLARRIRQFDKQDQPRLLRRIRIGRFLSKGVSDTSSSWLGKGNPLNTYWVLAVCTNRPAKMVNMLREAGFDATTQSSLCDASDGYQLPDGDRSARSWLTQTVFLPCDPSMPAEEIRRLRNTILTFLGRTNSLQLIERRQ